MSASAALLKRVLRAGLALVLVGACRAPARAEGLLQDLPPGEYAYYAATLLDVGTTLDLREHPGLREANPLLGDHPSDARVWATQGALTAAHTAVTLYMVRQGASRRAIAVWECVTVGAHLAAAGSNLSLGLRFRF